MRQSQILRLILFLAAAGLVAGIIGHLGLDQILGNLSLVGWKIIFVFLLGFPRFFLNMLGWRIFLGEADMPLLRLYAVKIAGELLTRATPLHFLGGDSSRVLLMGEKGSRSRWAASVLIDRTAITIGGGFFILSGMILGSFLLPLSTAVKVSLAGIMLLIAVFFIFLITQQKRGVIASALRLFHKMHLLQWISPRWREKIETVSHRVDETLKSYYAQGHGKLAAAVFLNFAGRCLAALEIYLLFHFLQIPLGLLHAFLLNSLSLTLSAAFFIVPGTLGLSEGSYGLFFQLLGLNPAVGVSLELSRKINGLLWFAFGGILALVFKYDTASSKQSPP